MPLSADLRVILSATQTGSNDFGGPVFAPLFDKAIALGSGTNANQSDIVFSDIRTLAASGTEDLDLAGVLIDAFGAVINAVEIVAVLIYADPANTNDVVVGAAAQPVPLFGGTAGTIAVRPGGTFLIAAPNAAGQFAVGAGATDRLRITNSGPGTPVTYQVHILGRSA